MVKILLVGDDPPEREVLALVMEFGGYRCTLAGSLKEAIHLLRREPFDLVVTDFKSSSRNTRDIAKRLKGGSVEAAVLILTEAGGSGVEEADEVLILPCTPQSLLQRIERLLRKSHGPASKKPSHREKGSSAQRPWRRTVPA